MKEDVEIDSISKIQTNDRNCLIRTFYANITIQMARKEQKLSG